MKYAHALNTRDLFAAEWPGLILEAADWDGRPTEIAKTLMDTIDQGAHQAQLFAELVPKRKRRLIKQHNFAAHRLGLKAARILGLSWCRACRKWWYNHNQENHYCDYCECYLDNTTYLRTKVGELTAYQALFTARTTGNLEYLIGHYYLIPNPLATSSQETVRCTVIEATSMPKIVSTQLPKGRHWAHIDRLTCIQ